MPELITTRLITYSVEVSEASIRDALIMEAAAKNGLTHEGKLIPGVTPKVTFDGRRGSGTYIVSLVRDPSKSGQAQLEAKKNG